jgi:preprotein translocase subunit SecD
MNSRWYISILIITLTLLGGIASKQHLAVPNQEIVLQFTSDIVTPDDTQKAITLVRQQLKTVGVDNIQVEEHQDGYLKITYYSNSDVDSIKEMLSKDTSLAFGYVSQGKNEPRGPSEDNPIAYNLDVYEIQQTDDISELGGKLALETKAEHDRFSNPNVFVPQKSIDENVLCSNVKVAYKFNKTVAIAIDNRSRKIPEVRAGPSSKGVHNLS